MSHDTLITPELGGFRVSYNKSELRNQVRNARKVHPVNTNFEYLLTVTEIMKAEVIASYFPTENEPSPITLNEELINFLSASKGKHRQKLGKEEIIDIESNFKSAKHYLKSLSSLIQ